MDAARVRCLNIMFHGVTVTREENLDHFVAAYESNTGSVHQPACVSVSLFGFVCVSFLYHAS